MITLITQDDQLVFIYNIRQHARQNPILNSEYIEGMFWNTKITHERTNKNTKVQKHDKQKKEQNK